MTCVGPDRTSFLLGGVAMNRRLVCALAFLATAALSAPAAGATIYNRSAGWTTAGMVPGTSTNNPVNGIWLYEHVTGGTDLAGADPWWDNAGTKQVWDDSWYGGGPLWARGNDLSPPIAGSAMTHNTGGNYPYAPRVSWIAPSDGFVSVLGSLSEQWYSGANSGVEIAIGKRNAAGGTTLLWSGTAQPSGPTSFALTGQPALQMVHVKQGDAIFWGNRAMANTGGWTDLNDSGMVLVHEQSRGELLGWWTFDDPANLGKDSSGQGKHATVNNGVQNASVPGQLGSGGSLQFNGTNTTASMPITGPMDPFTLSFWINPASRTNYNQVIGAGGWDQFVFHTEVNGGIYTGTNVGSRFSPADLPAGTLALNTWQHFAFTFDNGVAVFYKNGVPIAMKTNMGLPNPWTSFAFSGNVHGLVDDVALWRGAQSPKVIHALAQGWIAPDDAYAQAVLNDNPIAYWRLDDAPGSTTARDLTGAHDGVYSGAVTLGQYRPFLRSAPNDAARFTGGSMRAESVDGLRDNFSVEFWIHPESRANYDQHIGAESGWTQFLFHGGASGEVWVGTGCCGGDRRFSLGANTLELNKWQHFVFTFEEISDTQGLARFYKNATLLAEGTFLKGDAWTAFELYGGADSFGLRGLVDEVAVYDYALTQAQILTHFGLAVPEPATLVLFSAGAAGLALASRRRRERR